MPVRIIHAAGTLALLAGLAWLLADRTHPALESAQALRGERWYRLLLDDRHIGYLHTRTVRDLLGRWQFHSDLRFVLNEGNPVRIVEHLAFEGRPPFELREASQHSSRPGSVEGTVITRANGGYRAAPVGPGSTAHRPIDLTFTLDDYLASETWLRESRPPPDATVNALSLDFERRRVVTRQFRVVDADPNAYEIENAAPLDPTNIQLDRRLRPVRMTLSGLFRLEQTSREQALAPRTALQAGSYFVPIDRRLVDHTRIRALELEVTGDAVATDLWPGLADGRTLRREANAVSTQGMLGDELRETAHHPVSDHRVRQLAREAVAGVTDPLERAQALSRFVSRYLSYRDDGIRRHVLGLLDDPVGDCSEFADLLTTLARSLDIPSRTVFGLAYADTREPAFRFHAWNELLVDGVWQVMDPTWDQLRVDATHIPMPADAAYAMELLTGGLEVAFVVRDVEYF